MDLHNVLKSCSLCPRNCHADRISGQTGVCGMGAEILAAKAYLHKWEEPCISYKNGAGTVFFSGCSLRCVYCQNYAISTECSGTVVSTDRLGDVFLSLQDKGADNIELVTPTHFVPQIINALDRVRHRLHIPVIYNSGGYEKVSTIDMLDGYIDVYLPDIKYFSPEISMRYSAAADYFEYASEAVSAMVNQVGRPVYNSDGGLVKGTVIRHLVLPSHRHDSIKIMEWIAEHLPLDHVLVSIMNQYTPFDFINESFPELKRRVTKMEYNSVVKRASELGINGFTQERSSASEEYVPDFDFSGLSHEEINNDN